MEVTLKGSLEIKAGKTLNIGVSHFLWTLKRFLESLYCSPGRWGAHWDFCPIPDPSTDREWVDRVVRTYFHKHHPMPPATVLLFSKMNFTFSLWFTWDTEPTCGRSVVWLRNNCLSRKKAVLLGGVGGSSNAHSHRLSNESTSKTILVLLLRVSDCSLEGKRDIMQT